VHKVLGSFPSTEKQRKAGFGALQVFRLGMFSLCV
jgi:hypothetical protein